MLLLTLTTGNFVHTPLKYQAEPHVTEFSVSTVLGLFFSTCSTLLHYLLLLKHLIQLSLKLAAVIHLCSGSITAHWLHCPDEPLGEVSGWNHPAGMCNEGRKKSGGASLLPSHNSANLWLCPNRPTPAEEHRVPDYSGLCTSALAGCDWIEVPNIFFKSEMTIFQMLKKEFNFIHYACHVIVLSRTFATLFATLSLLLPFIVFSLTLIHQLDCSSIISS